MPPPLHGTFADDRDRLWKILKDDYGIVVSGNSLGQGGFGHVYSCERNGLPWALKVTTRSLDGSDGLAQQEAKSLDFHHRPEVRQHPGIVHLHDQFEVGATASARGYLVTLWDLGDHDLEKTLNDRLAQGETGIPCHELLRLLYSVAEAIDDMNSVGIFHRDLKPENLILFGNRVRIADLGLAKFVGAATTINSVGGTAGYLPAEMLGHAAPMSQTCDIFSLAVIYAECLSGRHPFGESSDERLKSLQADKPNLNGATARVTDVLRRALSKDASQRPTKAVELIGWLRDAVGSDEPKPVAAGAPVSPRIVPRTPREWIVDAMHRGHFTRISDAIATALPGDIIKIRPGTYAESLLIDKPLELVGDGNREDIVIEGVDESAVTFRSSDGRLQNLSVRQRRGAGETHHGVVISQGHLRIEQCDIQSDCGWGVHVAPAARLTMRQCHIHDGAKGAVHVLSRAESVLTDNELSRHVLSHVLASDGASVRLVKNQIHHGQDNGVELQTGATATLIENEFRRHTNPQIFVRGSGTRAKVFQNQVRDGASSGISVNGGAEAELVENVIEKHQRPQVVIDDAGTKAKVVKNQVSDGATNGIRVYDGAEVELVENVIEKHTFPQVAISGANTKAKVVKNWVRDAASNGIYVFDSAEAELVENVIEKHQRPQVVIDDAGTKTKVVKNQVSDGATNGIQVSGSAEAELVGNVIEKHQKLQVSIFGAGTNAKVVKNQVRDGAGNGIQVSDSAEAEMMENVIEKHSFTQVAICGANTKAKVLKNQVHDGAQVGINVKDGAEAVIEDCRINGNATFGVKFVNYARGSVVRNDLKNNQKGAMKIAEGCEVTCSDNVEK